MSTVSFTSDELREMYFDYIYTLSGLNRQDAKPNLSKRKFAEKLHSIPFKKYDAGDDSRAADGSALRYQFSMTMRDAYFSELDFEEFKAAMCDACDFPCSTFEMMVGLADKMENIMADPDYPDRHVQWVSKMLTSLGLTGYRQEVIDATPDWEKTVEDVIEKAYNREYKPDGDGGFFHIVGLTQEEVPDMRELPLWEQAMAYLNKLT